jgi:hypothetical protein
VAARLSQARDSEVMVETLDALVARHPRKLKLRGVRKLRKRLVAERRRARRRGIEDAHTRALALQELRALRGRVAAWELRFSDSEVLDGGLRKIYRAGRRRRRKVAHSRRRERDEAQHAWRKRVKDLRYCAEMLQRDPRGHGRDTRLARIAERADALGELLGEDHDLVLLTQLLERRSTRKTIGRRARRRLRRRIQRRRATLRRRALRRGARLYRDPPSDFIAAVRKQLRAEARAARAQLS